MIFSPKTTVHYELYLKGKLIEDDFNAPISKAALEFSQYNEDSGAELKVTFDLNGGITRVRLLSVAENSNREIEKRIVERLTLESIGREI